MCALAMVAFLSGQAVAAERMTIVGTVNDSQQIVTEDYEIYQIVVDKKGSEVIDLIYQKVRVVGTVEESEDEMTIKITNYQVLEEM
jgi:hypothetical protein